MKFTNWLTSFLDKKLRVSNSNTIQEREDFFESGHSTPQYSYMRRYPRFSVEAMDIRTKMIFTEPIHLANLSVGGACIATDAPMAVGNNVLLNFNRERIRRPLSGTIIWQKKTDNRSCRTGGKALPLFKSGIQFKGVNYETLIQLKDFMRLCGDPEDQTYVGLDKSNSLRFVILRDEKAMLYYPITNIVKKISIGGMLVETHCKLDVEQKYPMALFLPNNDKPVNFHGRIASNIELPGRESRFDTGIEFCNLTEDAKAVLKKFIINLIWKHQV